MDKALEKLYQSGFQRRAEQEDMMRHVQRAVADGKVAVLEGGTGIGKSFGYLIPALEQAGKKTIVVATGTVALQEQLVDKDLPTLQSLIGKPNSFAIAKGRRRYACNTRLEEMAAAEAQTQGELLMAGDGDAPSDPEGDTIMAMHRALSDGDWNGDLDGWSDPVSRQVRGSITTDRHGCLGRRCAKFQDCAFFTARNHMRNANVIVANHDLLLADIDLQANGHQGILPPISECVYIIDEAHHFAQKAVGQFAVSANVNGARDWLEEVSKLIEDVPETLRGKVWFAERSAHECIGMLEQLATLLEANFEEQKDPNGTWLFKGPPTDVLREPGTALAKAVWQLHDHLSAAMDVAKDTAEQDPEAMPQKVLASIGFLMGRVENLGKAWAGFVADDPDDAPIARWIERVQVDGRSGKGRFDFKLSAAPVSAAERLYGHFWDQIDNGAVLCSATLRALGEFTKFVGEAGLAKLADEKVVTQVLRSPFDYSKSVLYVPPMKTEPSGTNRQAHTDEVVDLLPGELAKEPGGAMVLFTSRATMRRVYERMPRELRSRILMQGEQSFQSILDDHRERIDSGRSSIIFGLESFGEGVDLPGDYCRHVIITALPFGVPDTPIDKTRAEWIKSLGGNPFMDISLPEASLKLTQRAGRLNRREADVGRITILDKRICTKRYGPMLLRNLPPFRLDLPNDVESTPPPPSFGPRRRPPTERPAYQRGMNRIRETLKPDDDPDSDGEPVAFAAPQF